MIATALTQPEHDWTVTQQVRHQVVSERSQGTPGDAVLGNMEYVRLLWDAFKSGGVPAMAALVPPDVEWRPSAAGGRALHGTEDLERFWCSREIVMPTLRMFHGRGDDVLVEAEYEPDAGSVRTVWLLYRFNEATPLEAIAFPDEAEARAYLPPPALDNEARSSRRARAAAAGPRSPGGRTSPISRPEPRD